MIATSAEIYERVNLLYSSWENIHLFMSVVCDTSDLIEHFDTIVEHSV